MSINTSGFFVQNKHDPFVISDIIELLILIVIRDDRGKEVDKLHHTSSLGLCTFYTNTCIFNKNTCRQSDTVLNIVIFVQADNGTFAVTYFVFVGSTWFTINVS